MRTYTFVSLGDIFQPLKGTFGYFSLQLVSMQDFMGAGMKA
jgi:hypothetical protein